MKYFLIVILALPFFAKAENPQKPPMPPHIEKMIKDTGEWVKMTEAEKITHAQGKVKSNLKDPESAQFRDVFVSPSKNVCGEMNAKNSYGGYTGYGLFYYSRLGDRYEVDTKKEYFDIFCK